MHHISEIKIDRLPSLTRTRVETGIAVAAILEIATPRRVVLVGSLATNALLGKEAQQRSDIDVAVTYDSLTSDDYLLGRFDEQLERLLTVQGDFIMGVLGGQVQLWIRQDKFVHLNIDNEVDPFAIVLYKNKTRGTLYPYYPGSGKHNF